jgi:hypothetical protein
MMLDFESSAKVVSQHEGAEPAPDDFTSHGAARHNPF